MSTPTVSETAAPCPRSPRRQAWRAGYLRALTCVFMLLTIARLLAYAPTVLAIVHSRDSRQHSLWTWLIWVGANITMAAWLYENNGQRLDKAVTVSLANAAACLLTCAVILWFRF